MPQTPSSSPLRQLWLKHLQNHLSVTLGHPLSWPAEVLTLQGHTSGVTSVAYSPLYYIPTDKQVADTFTKNLTWQRFEDNRKRLQLIPYSRHIE
jgi:hypothetical protein